MPSLKTLLKRKGLPPPSGFVDCRAEYAPPPTKPSTISVPVKMDPESIRHAGRIFLAVCEAKQCPSPNLQTAIIVMLDELHRLKSQA